MRHSKRGFTLVELNLSMIFVALLLLLVAATTIHISRLYERGVTIKTVNQAGREIMSQMSQDIAAAQPGRPQLETAGATGRLCLGNVSYLYNTAAGLAGGVTPSQLFHRGDSSNPVGLVRVLDANRSWCERSGGAFVKPTTIDAGLFTGDMATATELIVLDEYAPSAIHRLGFTRLAANQAGNNGSLYRLSMLLGTNQVGSIDQINETCRPPDSNQANFDSCFVADFTTVIRSGG